MYTYTSERVKCHEIRTFYSLNGKIIRKETYLGNKPDGYTIYYDSNGICSYKYFCRLGEFEGESYYYASGRVRSSYYIQNMCVKHPFTDRNRSSLLILKNNLRFKTRQKLDKFLIRDLDTL